MVNVIIIELSDVGQQLIKLIMIIRTKKKVKPALTHSLIILYS